MRDGQVVELMGRNLLATALLRDGLEIARPERDRGIDLIAYRDRPSFKAVPIQMKASSKAALSIDRRYERIADLRIVYVWYVDTPNSVEIYCLSFKEAMRLAAELGWTTTRAWAAGVYTTNRPSHAIRTVLRRHRVELGAFPVALGFDRDLHG